MKILFLCRLFYPHIGGVEKHVMEISKNLIQKGHSVTVIAELEEGNGKHEVKGGVTIYRIATGKESWVKKIIIWKELYNYKKIIQEADIIHCHDVFFWYLPFRFIFFNKKVFTTFHGYESYPITKKAIMIRKLSEKLSWGNICIGDFIAKWYGTNPTFVIYGGVKLKNKTQSQKTKSESAVFIGRLDEQTNILQYTKAVRLLRKKYPSFDFLVVGDGKYRKKIEKSAKLLGWQANPEKYIQQSHFVFVSRYLSILEALESKRLVFALYDNPVKKDYLTMAPFSRAIVIMDNEQDIAKQLEYFLSHPEEEEKRIAQGYKWVKSQTWEQVTNTYEMLWNQKAEKLKKLI